MITYTWYVTGLPAPWVNLKRKRNEYVHDVKGEQIKYPL